MGVAGKDLAWYWEGVRWPLLLLVAWSVAGVVVMHYSLESYLSVFGSRLLGFVIPVLFYLLAGYLITADLKADPKQAAWGGALTGLVVGVVGSLLLVFTFSTMVQLGLDEASEAMADQGVVGDLDAVEGFLKVSLVVGAFIGPFFSALMGALFAWIGHLLAEKVEG